MKNALILCLASTFLSVHGSGQLPADKLSKWAATNPIEKLYLHCDRDEYMAGQTIWFKAYLCSEFLPHEKSSAVFVELLNAASSIISRKTFPAILSMSNGQLELPDTLSSGMYFLRAYTPTMLNHDPEFVYARKIIVTGKSNKIRLNPDQAAKKIRMEFFPEGGNLVEGHPNTVAFKITDESGMPFNTTGILKNGKGETLSEFATYHDGMGMADLDVVASQSYHVVLKNDLSGLQYPLPAATAKGIVFRLMSGKDGIRFEILQKKNDPAFEAAYMIGQMQHNIIFIQPLKQGTTSLTGLIKTHNLSSGILHITVFNKDGMPLAERLSFVNNKEYVLPATLVTDTVNFSAHGKNRFTISLADTIIGNFSVSVTDPAFNALSRRAENILSTLLLTSDLKGYIHDPAYYFTSDSDSASYAIDLLMMTNGWRRFKWSEVSGDSLPARRFNDPGFIRLSGSVRLDGTKKPFADKDMMLFVAAADSSRNTQMIKTDAQGRYDVDSLIFFGKANILFSDVRGKKSKFVDIKPSGDSLNRSYPLPLIDRRRLAGKDADRELFAKKMQEEYEKFVKANGLVLSEVVIRSRKKTPLEELEEKYTSGAFSGDNRRSFDLLNSDEAAAYMNIFDFLQSKVPGISVSNANGDYAVYYRQMATISALGNQEMDIFLDEVKTDATAVAFIPTNQIALVKVFSNFIGSTGGGAGGAIAVYMKKGSDYFASIPSAGEVITYNGFSVIREFYSPNYSVSSKSQVNPDHRMTLYWNPDIFLNSVNPRIPIVFHNNDRSSSFKVVVEGMTIDGRMLMIERLVTPKPF